MAYTTIDDPSAHFQTVLWTGDGTDGRAITNDGNSDLQPDFVWGKTRSIGISFWAYDSTRGATKRIYTDFANTEATITNGLQSFDTDGFTIGNNGEINGNTYTLVGWQWKANGGTTSSNTDGTITTTVQANTTAGFSIVTYTGNGSTGQTIGHGLGVAPDFMIVKNRGQGYNWVVYHKELNSSPEDYYIPWNTTDAATLATDIFGGSAATSTVIGVKNFNETNASSSNYVAYCFAEKQGYSKFGKYTGGGATNVFVYTGFKPNLIMIKRIDSTSNWTVWDSKRDPYNVGVRTLFPNGGNAEETNNANEKWDILSNGFKFRSNGRNTVSGGTYIYMAFAEQPFVTSTGIPTTAR